MKTELIAGDTLDFVTEVSSYPASAGWTLRFRLVPRSGAGSAITFNAATYETTKYRVQVGNSTTANWAAGEYSWWSYVETGTERYTVDSGLVKILPNPASITPHDLRSHARKMLDAVEAAIEALNLKAKAYTIGSRSYTRAELPELITLRDRYRREVADEDAREKLAAGLPNPRDVYIRFGGR